MSSLGGCFVPWLLLISLFYDSVIPVMELLWDSDSCCTVSSRHNVLLGIGRQYLGMGMDWKVWWHLKWFTKEKMAVCSADPEEEEEEGGGERRARVSSLLQSRG